MSIPISCTEKSFSRLLTRCENSIAEREPKEWRLEQYVKNLEERLLELKKLNTCQPSKDSLAEYSRRVEFLRGIVEAEKMPTATEKALANQLLSPGSPATTSSKIHQQTKAHYLQEMREELLGCKEEPSSVSEGLRLRHIADVGAQDDFDAVMRYHNSMQEKVAEEMMSLVQNLKQNSILTGNIIRKDTEILEKATSMADDRYSQLKVESDRIEVYAKKSCNWCVWIMLGAVCFLFMWMIVFIRLFPKR